MISSIVPIAISAAARPAPPASCRRRAACGTAPAGARRSCRPGCSRPVRAGTAPRWRRRVPASSPVCPAMPPATAVGAPPHRRDELDEALPLQPRGRQRAIDAAAAPLGRRAGGRLRCRQTSPRSGARRSALRAASRTATYAMSPSGGQAVQHRVDRSAVVGLQAALGQLGEHRRDGAALRAKPARLVPQLLPQVEAGRRDDGEEDEADGQQVELRQQPHPHRRQVRRHRRLALETGAAPWRRSPAS